MKLKKMLCSILALAMILSTMSFSVFADETTAVAQIGEKYYKSFEAAIADIKEDGSDTTIKLLESIEVSGDVKFKYGSGDVIFTADNPVTVKQTATGADFCFTTEQDMNIVVEENVTFEIFDNTSDMQLYYGPSLKLNGTITGGENWGSLYLFQGEHQVSETGKVATGRVQIRRSDVEVKGEVDTNYLLVEKSTFVADGATIDANEIYDNNNGGQRDGASNFEIKNGSKVTTSKLTLSYADSELTIDTKSSLIADEIVGEGTIKIDAVNYSEGDAFPISGNISGFNGEIEIINDAKGNLKIFTDDSGNISIKKAVASVKDANGETVFYTSLQDAINAAQDGETIILTDDIDYTGTASLEINKAVTLDLGGKTLTTHGTYGGLILKGNCSLKNGTLAHKGTVTAIKAWNVEAIEDVVIDVAFKAEGKTIGGIVIQNVPTNRIDTIKNVTIKGDGLTNGIETYNCGDAAENVIGSMENVTIDAKSTGMLISAPCGTAENCTIKGGTTGIELWIKGTYSATLDLVDCDVESGEQTLNIHDEYSSNPDIVNNGTLKLTADDATTFTSESGKPLKLTIARAENVVLGDNILKLKNTAVALIDDTYYTSLQAAINGAVNGNTITLLEGITEEVEIKNKEVIINLNGFTLNGAIKPSEGNITVQNGTIVNKNASVSAIEVNRGTLNINNVNVESARHAVRIDGDVLAVVDGGEYTLNATSGTRHAVNVSGAADVTIKNGTFVGPKGTAMDSGSAVCVQVGATVTIEGGNFSGGKNETLGVSGTMSVKGGTFDQDPSAYVADGFDAVRTANGYAVETEDKQADGISVEYKDVTVTGTEGEKTYEIVVKANEGDVINELASVDLTFAYTSEPVTGGNIEFTVAPATDFAMTRYENTNRYMFNYNGVDAFEGTENAITVGTITVTGYGAYTIATADLSNETKDTNIVNATTFNDNLVDSYTAAGATDDDATTGALDITGNVVSEIAVPTRTLKINIDFPNAVNANAAAYQDMKVEITGNIEGVNKTVTYDLGEDMVDGSYVVTEAKLVLNNAYTVTVSGAGYRTARYTVTMTDDKELKFWNNVMDEAQVVEIGKDSSAVTKNFLAGDIVKDNNINIYDLSAVVSYFGTENLVSEHPEYAKYDLNRDGVIDSKDVAYVLVSWGE